MKVLIFFLVSYAALSQGSDIPRLKPGSNIQDLKVYIEKLNLAKLRMSLKHEGLFAKAFYANGPDLLLGSGIIELLGQNDENLIKVILKMPDEFLVSNQQKVIFWLESCLNLSLSSIEFLIRTEGNSYAVSVLKRVSDSVVSHLADDMSYRKSFWLMREGQYKVENKVQAIYFKSSLMENIDLLFDPELNSSQWSKGWQLIIRNLDHLEMADFIQIFKTQYAFKYKASLFKRELLQELISKDIKFAKTIVLENPRLFIGGLLRDLSHFYARERPDYLDRNMSPYHLENELKPLRGIEKVSASIISRLVKSSPALQRWFFDNIFSLKYSSATPILKQIEGGFDIALVMAAYEKSNIILSNKDKLKILKDASYHSSLPAYSTYYRTRFMKELYKSPLSTAKYFFMKKNRNCNNLLN